MAETTNEPECGVEVALYGVAYGDLYEPCRKPRGHDGGHDPSAPAPSEPDPEAVRALNIAVERGDRRAFEAAWAALDAPAPSEPGRKLDPAWAERVIDRWAPDSRSRAIEKRARELAGGVHARGAIPARFWQRAIEEADAPAPSEPGLDVETLERALLLHAGEFIAEPESFDSRRLVAENIAAIYARLRGEQR